MTLEIILIIFSIILSAFFSSAEVAFLSVQKTKLFHMVNLKQKGADTVAKLLENKDKLLSTIVLGNNIVNITFAALLTSLIYKITTILTTLFGTIILMIFGEVIPKALAVRLAEKLSLIYSRPLKILEIIFNPIVLILTLMINIIDRKSKLNYPGNNNSVTEEELLTVRFSNDNDSTLEEKGSTTD